MSQISRAMYAYVGSFVMPTPGAHDGLHVFRVDSETGALTPVSSHIPSLNVGSFALDPQRGVLYVTDEVASTSEFREQHQVAGGGGGRIFAFTIDRATGGLSELGHWPSYGTQPAGIALHPSGNFLVVSHFTNRTTITTQITGTAQLGFSISPRYDDATTVLFPIDAIGRIGAPCHIHIHAPTSPPSCLHSITLFPTSTNDNNKFYLECDMLQDKLLTFTLADKPPLLRIHASHATPKGSGPRYSAFHPTLPVFYVNYEYHPIIETFTYQTDGSFASLSKVEVLPSAEELAANYPPPEGKVLLSDLKVHPGGGFVYTLVRGYNVLSVFRVDHTTGGLERIQTVGLMGGVSPKGCAVSPDGRFVYVALSVSGLVQVWRVEDENGGRLVFTGSTVSVPRPGAVLVVEI
ncbi:putative isomerase YbhE [Aspergillus japonicus CBS 114.51]|uniref:Putative isomerase YbhE n=1 Tax=Aspergillus japonicus CBS 114.51 TaxID=1448312 RepID=A0A8T8X1E0_ASPJA|nr:putative isomerase YbhE [Aspergillus japonicus CBS 114.51]RAH81957.1 putative isomerase YbhE [Aspergillus japonicus CBS 114.51]